MYEGRLAPTPLAAGEPSPALLVRTHGSSTRPALPRLPSVPPLDRPLAKLRAQDLFYRQAAQLNSSLLLSLSRRKNQPTTLNQLFSKPPCPPFVARCSAPSLRPVFSPASLRASPRSFLRGRALSLSLHPAPFGGRGSQFWLGAREIIPPKRGPSLT